MAKIVIPHSPKKDKPTPQPVRLGKSAKASAGRPAEPPKPRPPRRPPPSGRPPSGGQLAVIKPYWWWLGGGVLLLLLLFGALMRLGGGGVGGLSGTIYTTFAGEAHRYELSSRTYSEKPLLLVGASAIFDDFDVSWDNRNLLLTLDVQGAFNFDERRYLLRPLQEYTTSSEVDAGGNLFDHTYEWGGISYTSAYLSPDGRYVALSAQHFSDLPVTLLDTQSGQTVGQWQDEQVSFLKYGEPIWALDGSLYFRIGSTLYRVSPADGYRSANRVAEVPGATNIAVDPQGSRLVYVLDKHLYLANLDGSNARQITTSRTDPDLSSGGESLPVFSPDGRHIAFSSRGNIGAAWSDHDYADGSWVAVAGGKFGYLTIIPADGRLYDLDDADSGAFYPNRGDGQVGIPLGSRPIWR